MHGTRRCKGDDVAIAAVAAGAAMANRYNQMMKEKKQAMITSIEYKALVITREVIALEKRIRSLEEEMIASGAEEPNLEDYVEMTSDGVPVMTAAGTAAIQEYEDAQGPS